ncbi:MAG: helix-turn-helix domain-containing protein [Oscillibacter sp.]|nr:helix-turn-helix domain-containing protein [Oscillibacter sp.]
MPDIQTILSAEKPLVYIEPVAVKASTVAQMLDISRPKVYELAAREDFHGAFKLGGCTLFSVEALREWVRRQCGEGSAE